MSDTEKPQTEAQEHGGLARDVARLYSFANAEDVPYRVFRKSQKPQAPPRIIKEVTEQPEAREQPAAAPVPAEPQPAQIEPVEIEPAQAQPAPPPYVAPPEAATAIVASATQPIAISTPAPPSGMYAAPTPPQPQWSEMQISERNAIAIASYAGGVGKTTLAANVGRILSERGERILLVDATGSNLLPFYFGAEDVRNGMRTFLAPEPDMPPIRTIGTERVNHEWLENAVKPIMPTAQRVIFDCGMACYSLMPEILSMCALIIVPLVVDLNSIMSIPRVEAHNDAMRNEHGLQLPRPIYVLNKLDESNERERQGRELISREVGMRLLPITIRRSSAVSEAISARMTVADYAPDSDIADDFIQLASWITQAAPITQPAAHSGRWSEA